MREYYVLSGSAVITLCQSCHISTRKEDGLKEER
jgi:hypothetical protein